MAHIVYQVLNWMPQQIIIEQAFPYISSKFLKEKEEKEGINSQRVSKG